MLLPVHIQCTITPVHKCNICTESVHEFLFFFIFVFMYFLCDNIVLFRQFQPFSSDRTDPTSNIHKFQNDYMKRRQKWAVNPKTYFVCHEIFLPIFL